MSQLSCLRQTCVITFIRRSASSSTTIRASLAFARAGGVAGAEAGQRLGRSDWQGAQMLRPPIIWAITVGMAADPVGIFPCSTFPSGTSSGLGISTIFFGICDTMLRRLDRASRLGSSSEANCSGVIVRRKPEQHLSSAARWLAICATYPQISPHCRTNNN